MSPGIRALALCATAALQSCGGAEPLAPMVASTEPALALDPARLPRAAPGSWSDRWQEQASWPEGAAQDYSSLTAAYQLEDLPCALSRAFDLLQQHADLPAALHVLGLTLFRLRRYADAALVFDRFLEHAPEQLARTRALGHCHYSLGRYAAAREHYQRILSEQPQSVETRHGLALAQMRLGESSAASGLLEAVLARAPAHADAAYWLARIEFDGERCELDQVLASCRRALELAPFDPRGWFLLAEVSSERGDVDEAARARARFERLEAVQGEVRALEQRLRYEPRLPGAAARLAQLLAEVGDAQGAAAVRERDRLLRGSDATR